MPQLEPYSYKEAKQISCSTTLDHVDLDYQPDEIILGNADADNIIYVDFDEVPSTSKGLPIAKGGLRHIKLRARRIYAITSAGTPTLFIVSLARERKKW